MSFSIDSTLALSVLGASLLGKKALREAAFGFLLSCRCRISSAMCLVQRHISVAFEQGGLGCGSSAVFLEPIALARAYFRALLDLVLNVPREHYAPYTTALRLMGGVLVLGSPLT